MILPDFMALVSAPSWVSMAPNVLYVGWSNRTRIPTDVKEAVVWDSFVLLVFGSLVMVL